MIVEGNLIRWDDERGFGFIAPEGGGADVFVHIKAFPAGSTRPVIGERLRFVIEIVQGRPRAARVKRVAIRLSPVPRRNEAAQWGGASLLSIPLFIALLAGLAFVWRLPKGWGLYYLAASVLCFALYAWDKGAARRGGRRTPEATLHLWSLLGGWPGALLAQQYLRHKSVKQAFRSTFWLTVLANVGGLVWLASPTGQAWFGSLSLALAG